MESTAARKTHFQPNLIIDEPIEPSNFNIWGLYFMKSWCNDVENREKRLIAPRDCEKFI